MDHDWNESDKRLYDVAQAAIAEFAKKHASEQVCCFFFDCDEPRYGRIAISLDTFSSNISSAKSLESYAIENRLQNLTGDITWQWAKYQLTSPVLSPFNTNSGDFQFPEFMKVTFPFWRKLAESGDCPSGTENDDDYLESNARLVMWRVAEKLVANHAFSALTLASPFLIGYSMHDQEEAILRLLNWPKDA